MIRRIALGLGVAVTTLVVLALVSFAIPIPEWRTGELPAPPLPVVEGGPPVRIPERVWIDTDAACGHGRTTDPDDCFAILLLAREQDVEIVGISTVYGNAPLDVTDRTARDLAAVLKRHDGAAPPVYRGSAGPLPEDGAVALEPAHAALRKALEGGPLTVVSLGPLTNLAAALRDRPDLAANVARLVAVMGRRPGHLFHPAEGAGDGILFGHGPVFRDFNVAKDPPAVARVLGMGMATTLVPYDAAREVSLTGADLADMDAQGGAAAWVASRARGWLGYWKDDVGRSGFYPFDLLAAAYVVRPDLFDCAFAKARVDENDGLWGRLFGPEALLVGPEPERPDSPRNGRRLVYCPRIDPGMHQWLMSRLAGRDRLATQSTPRR